ncbi:MAG TPA: hypothetical protein VHS99_26840 [Chloroflexota bacterium]|nr:hypothetical protein [Chloroflexota bacterium]
MSVLSELTLDLTFAHLPELDWQRWRDRRKTGHAVGFVLLRGGICPLLLALPSERSRQDGPARAADGLRGGGSGQRLLVHLRQL